MHPVYLLAGGRAHMTKGPDPLLRQALAQAGKPRPTVAYVGVASDDDTGFLRWLTALFKAAGAGAVHLAPMASPSADLDEARRVLASADLVYVTGGDVEHGMNLLKARRMIQPLRRLWRSGVPFFGLSAGSIMLAEGWVRWTDPDDDTTTQAFDCLGFAPVLCDTHAEADGWEELHALLRLSKPGTVGYGIPSGGALRVGPGGAVQALGNPAPRFVRKDDDIVELAPLEADS